MAFLARNLGILVWLDIVQAAPTQNLTALRTETAPSWVSDPDDRGTWSLLYSCIFTLALCVWTAVHPNVPSQDFQRGPGKYGKKLLFVLFAMLAPEYGVCVAFTQFQRARSLAQELSELRTRHAQKIPYIPISSAPDHLVSHCMLRSP